MFYWLYKKKYSFRSCTGRILLYVQAIFIKQWEGVINGLDIESLNEEEFRKLCESIGANAFKKLFEKFPEDFSKIYSVFKAKNLKEDKVIDLVVKNRSKKFISDFVFGFKSIAVEKWRIDNEQIINQM